MGRKNCRGAVSPRFPIFAGGEGVGVKKLLDDGVAGRVLECGKARRCV